MAKSKTKRNNPKKGKNDAQKSDRSKQEAKKQQKWIGKPAKSGERKRKHSSTSAAGEIPAKV
jgi:hypothetical protein